MKIQVRTCRAEANKGGGYTVRNGVKAAFEMCEGSAQGWEWGVCAITQWR